MNLLNPEAGAVPLPTDTRELAVAVRAANTVLRAFPYYGFRYGDRGRRFGQSDAGYLLSLIQRPQAEIDHQIAWLAGVLAARGMPSWLLELQLRVLARVATRTLGHPARYAPLVAAAEVLRAQREAKLSAQAFDTAGNTFARAVGMPAWRVAQGTGRMLACAVADEANGVAEAVPSLLRWLADPTLFDLRWCAAAEHAVALARDATRAV